MSEPDRTSSDDPAKARARERLRTMIRGDSSEDLMVRLTRARAERDEAVELLKHTADPPGSVMWHASYKRMWDHIEELKGELEAIQESKEFWKDRFDFEEREAATLLAWAETLKQALRDHHVMPNIEQADCLVCQTLVGQTFTHMRISDHVNREEMMHAMSLDDVKQRVLESISEALKPPMDAGAAESLARTYATLNAEVTG